MDASNSASPHGNTMESILQQPIVGDWEDMRQQAIGNLQLVDIDARTWILQYVNWKNRIPESSSPESDQNQSLFRYVTAQENFTETYQRILRADQDFFVEKQLEPVLTYPCSTSTTMKEIYEFTPYPNQRDGEEPPYPPHLKLIPGEDKVSALKIFNPVGLVQARFIMNRVVPEWVETPLRWVWNRIPGNGRTPNSNVTMHDLENYNQNHRKSRTDILQGRNIGILKDWYSDRRFAEQSFTGTNPTTIEKVSETLLEEFIKAAKNQAKRSDIDKSQRTLLKDWATDLQKKDSAFFVQDFSKLRQAIGNPTGDLKSADETRWACASVTLFQLHPNGKLHPIAIAIDYKESLDQSVTIFNKSRKPSDPTNTSGNFSNEETDWSWRYAKTCAQVSDWIHHEIGVHLTRSHFVEEIFIIATRRHIPPGHIIYTLLEPHWYKTLSLNANARDVLVPEVIQNIVGLQPLDLKKLIDYEFRTFDFVQSYVPKDLEKRGFPVNSLRDGMYKNYAYAKNISELWECIRGYVMEMLQTHYQNGKVALESFIKDWYEDIQHRGHIKSFPNISNMDDLCNAITMMIHIAAPFHTSVNYLQNFYQAFVPAKPPALNQALPKTIGDLEKYTEKDLINALPIQSSRQWLLAAHIPWLLSFQVEDNRSLLTYARSQWYAHRFGPYTDPDIETASKKFHDDLLNLSVQFVQTSNGMDEGSIPYMVLDPRSTAVSILI